VKAQAPAGLLGGFAPSSRRRGAGNLITSRKNAGRFDALRLFFLGVAKRHSWGPSSRVRHSLAQAGRPGLRRWI